MIIFKKLIDDRNSYSNTEVMLRIPGPDINLDEACEAFGDFLRGCGYVFDGSVMIVNEDEKVNE